MIWHEFKKYWKMLLNDKNTISLNSDYWLHMNFMPTELEWLIVNQIKAGVGMALDWFII